MLDAIPIVKFSKRCDSKEDQTVHRDIELANTSEARHEQTSILDNNDLPIS